MADRYWNPAAAGNWNATSSWSASDGGATGASVPTSSDNVFFTSTNNNNCTVNVTSNMLNLSFTGGTGYTGTISGTSMMNVYGNLTMSSGMTRTHTGHTYLKATSTGKTVTLNGISLSTVYFDGVGGEWTLQDAFSVSNLYVVNGSFVSNNQSITGSGQFVSSYSNVRSVALGSSTIVFSSSLNFATTTNLTFDAGTSDITCGSFNATGLTFYDVTLTGVTCYGSSTFNNLSKVATGDDVLTVESLSVTGTLTLSGVSGAERLWVKSKSYVNNATLTAGAVSLSYADFSKITAAGAASPFTGTSLGNIVGNSNITFVTPVTRYWVGGTGSYSETAHWSDSSGGAGGQTVPLVQDTVYFDSNSFTAGNTLTLDVVKIRELDMSNTTNSPNVTFASSTGNGLEIFGNINLTGVGTFTDEQKTTLRGLYGTYYITSAGKQFAYDVEIYAYGSTYNLADDYTGNAIAGSWLAPFDGNFNSNNYTIAGEFYSSLSTEAVGHVDLGTSSLITDGSGTIFYVDDSVISPDFTYDFTNCRIFITNNSTSDKYLYLGAEKYNEINVNTQDTGKTSFYNTPIIKRLNIDAGRPIVFGRASYGYSFTISALNASGTLGNLTTFESSTAGMPFSIIKNGNDVKLDYMSIKDCAATGSSTFYAGSHSTNVSGNSGWSFTDFPGGGRIKLTLLRA